MDEQDDEGEEAPEDNQLTAVEEVMKLENMYERKVGKIIKQHISAENDPVQFLAPTSLNADLKRKLSLKLQRVNMHTDKAILELLK